MSDICSTTPQFHIRRPQTEKHVDTITIENQFAWYRRSGIFRVCARGPSVVKQTERTQEILCFHTFIWRFVDVRFYTSHLEDDSDVLASNKQITKAQLAHRKPLLNHRDGLNMCQRELCRKKKNAFQFQMFFFFGAEVYGGIKGTGCVFPRVRSLVNKARLLTSLCVFLWFPTYSDASQCQIKPSNIHHLTLGRKKEEMPKSPKTRHRSTPHCRRSRRQIQQTLSSPFRISDWLHN